MSMKSMTERYIAECERRKLPYVDAEENQASLLEALHCEGESTLSHLPQGEAKDALDWIDRFIRVRDRVQGEELVLQRLIIESLRIGYRVSEVDDGEQIHKIADNTSLSDMVELAMAVDESILRVRHKDTGKRLRFMLIAGNSPEEYIADHSDHPDAELIWQAVKKGA